jgi:hypothetical protein
MRTRNMTQRARHVKFPERLRRERSGRLFDEIPAEKILLARYRETIIDISLHASCGLTAAFRYHYSIITSLAHL